jgi:hypothetical protein
VAAALAANCRAATSALRTDKMYSPGAPTP